MVLGLAFTLPVRGQGEATVQFASTPRYEDFTGMASQGGKDPHVGFWHPLSVSNLLLDDAGGHLTLHFTDSTSMATIHGPDFAATPIREPGRYLVLRLAFDLVESPAPGTASVPMSLAWRPLPGEEGRIWWEVDPALGWQTLILDLEHPGRPGDPAPADPHLTACFAEPGSRAFGEGWLERFTLRVGEDTAGEGGQLLAGDGNLCRIDRLAFLESYESHQKQAFVARFPGLNQPVLGGSSAVWKLGYPNSPLADVRREVRWSGNGYLTVDEKDSSAALVPRIGLYSNLDPHVIEYQVLLAKAAGFDGFFSGFGGTGLAIFDPSGAPLDPCAGELAAGAEVLLALKEVAADYDFDVGVHWNNGSLGQMYTFLPERETYLEQAKFDLRWVLGTLYGAQASACPSSDSRDVGIRVADRPVLPIFSTREETGIPAPRADYFTPAEIQVLKDDLATGADAPALLVRTRSFLFNGNIPVLFEGVADGFYSWHRLASGSPVFPVQNYNDRLEELTYFENFLQEAVVSKNQGNIEFHLGSAVSRFDDHKSLSWGSGQVHYVDGDDGRTLVETLERNLGLNPSAPPPGTDVLFLGTWNDYAEGTSLEPTYEFGYGDLEAVATRLAAWKGTTFDPDLLRLPERLLLLRRAIAFLGRVDPECLALVDCDGDPGTSAADEADDIGRILAARDPGRDAGSRLACLEAALSARIASLEVTRIDLVWNPASGHEDLLPTVIPEPGAEGGVLLEKSGAYNTLEFAINGFEQPGVQALLAEGEFVGTVSFELHDVGVEEVLVRVDHPDVIVILHERKRDSGEWRRVEADLVGATFLETLNGGFLRFVDTGSEPDVASVREVRIHGLVYGPARGTAR